MPNPVNPNNPHSPPPKTPSTPPKDTPFGAHGKGDIEGKPMNFLGMQFSAEEAKKFWDNLIRAINDQIQKDKDKSVKAIKNFGKSPGDPDYQD